MVLDTLGTIVMRVNILFILGGAIIEDDVDIGAHICIDRGALANTVIKRGVKIDNLVHIA